MKPREPATADPADTTPSPHIEPLLTPRQAGELLGLTESGLERMRRERRGPAWIRCGRLCRYAPAAIREYIASQTVETAGQ